MVFKTKKRKRRKKSKHAIRIYKLNNKDICKLIHEYKKNSETSFDI